PQPKEDKAPLSSIPIVGLAVSFPWMKNARPIEYAVNEQFLKELDYSDELDDQELEEPLIAVEKDNELEQLEVLENRIENRFKELEGKTQKWKPTFLYGTNKLKYTEKKPGAIPVIMAKASIVKGFVGYRDLLQLHFRQHNSQPDLFSFFLGQTGLFADMITILSVQPANKISYKDLWEKIQNTKAHNDISDYNTNAYAQFLELEDRANMLLRYFQKECDLKIEYQEMELQGEDLVLPSISFKIKLFEKELPEHEEVLNEARLTALAISVYLAYILGLPATDLRILFLDDIFIGLDMTN